MIEDIHSYDIGIARLQTDIYAYRYGETPLETMRRAAKERDRIAKVTEEARRRQLELEPKQANETPAHREARLKAQEERERIQSIPGVGAIEGIVNSLLESPLDE